MKWHDTGGIVCEHVSPLKPLALKLEKQLSEFNKQPEVPGSLMGMQMPSLTPIGLFEQNASSKHELESAKHFLDAMNSYKEAAKFFIAARQIAKAMECFDIMINHDSREPEILKTPIKLLALKPEILEIKLEILKMKPEILKMKGDYLMSLNCFTEARLPYLCAKSLVKKDPEMCRDIDTKLNEIDMHDRPVLSPLKTGSFSSIHHCSSSSGAASPYPKDATPSDSMNTTRATSPMRSAAGSPEPELDSGRIIPFTLGVFVPQSCSELHPDSASHSASLAGLASVVEE